jgi:Cdc6-like AAA superfamily ATPase
MGSLLFWKVNIFSFSLLVLDEIDQLDSRKQSVLYTVFEWPSTPNSKLVLIGIANALDLTDRILPRLQARLDLRPQLLHFAPYTKLEIVNILTERLIQVNMPKIRCCKYYHIQGLCYNDCYCIDSTVRCLRVYSAQF